jgi:hypothetical protein
MNKLLTFARLRKLFGLSQFLTQNLHQLAGLISPSTSVKAFGSWNRLRCRATMHGSSGIRDPAPGAKPARIEVASRRREI